MSVVQGLIDKLRSEPDEIEVELPGIGVLKFRRIADASEWYAISRSANEWYGAIKKGLVPPDLKAVSPGSREIAQACYLLAHASTDPKISEIEACQIAKLGGPVFWELVNRLRVTTLESISSTEEVELDEAGEG